MKVLSRILALAAAAAIAMPATVLAQEGAEEAIEEVVVTGTRSKPRSAADSPVPIDSFGEDQLAMQPVGDMTESLKNLVPSFTATPLSGDASAFVRPVSLRGLPPDETLLLVNSKRRHRSALLAQFGAAMNFGAHASDMGMIPSVALKRVEVLRDGAAAQYGSDAIAGVINLILRDDDAGGHLEAQYGQYYEGEDALKVAGWAGFRLGDDGFINFSAEWTDNQQLIRSVQRPDAQALIDGGAANVGTDTPYDDAPNAQTWGRPENDGIRTAWNMAVSLNDDAELYSFGNYASTEGNYRFFYRNGSLTPAGDSGWHTSLRQMPIDPTDPDGDGIPGLPGLFEGNFCWCDTLTGGYTPYFVGKQTDFASVVGVRGEFSNGTLYDFSGNFGTNLHEYTLFNSLNASYGPDSQRDFKTGDQKESDRSLNADFSYPMSASVNVAFGFEWREEKWTAYAAERQSWDLNGPWADVGDLTDPGTGLPYSTPPGGSNGREGYVPEAAGTFARDNWAVYGDVEWDVSDAFLLQVALRFEDFSDFGTTTNGKVAARYSVSDTFTLRGAVSTGFRAPTPGQNHQRILATSFDVASNAQTLRLTLPAVDPLLIPFGGQALDPEDATNISLGFSWDIGDSVTLTADVYSIEVTDRITKADRIDVGGLPQFDELGADTISFYTNALDTDTTGFDLVLTWGLDHSGGSSTDISFAYNHNETDVSNLDVVDPNCGCANAGRDIIGDQTVFNIEENLPNDRASISVVHFRDQWSFTFRANWYGEAFDEREYPNGEPIDAAATVDLEGRYSFSDSLTLVVGANNAFDQFPNKNDTRAGNGLLYSRRTPFGYDGGMWYLKAMYDF